MRETIRTIKNAPDSGGGSGTNASAQDKTGLDTNKIIQNYYQTCCDRIAENFGNVYDRKSTLAPLGTETEISEINQSFMTSFKEYQKNYQKSVYYRFKDVLDGFRANGITPEDILRSSALTESNSQVLQQILTGNNPEITSQIDQISQDDFLLITEQFQHFLGNVYKNSLSDNQNGVSRSAISKNLESIIRNVQLHRTSTLSIKNDFSALISLDPKQAEMVKRLKVNSYLVSILGEIDSYADQIRSVFETEFDEKNTDENIKIFNRNLINFRNNFQNLSDNLKIEYADKYKSLLDPNNPNYFAQVNRDNIGIIYSTIFETLEDLTLTSEFLYRFLTEETITDLYFSAVKDNAEILKFETTNPVTQKNCCFNISGLRTPSQFSQPRVRLSVTQSAQNSTSKNIRLDSSNFGTELDMDFGIVSVLLPSHSQTLSLDYRHTIDSTTRRDAKNWGINLPYHIEIPQVQNNQHIPVFSEIVSTMFTGIREKLK